MAVIYEDKICVLANELISYNPKTGVGSEKGFILENTFYTLKSRKQITVCRRGQKDIPALVDFESMRPDIKRKYVETYGDPYSELATRSQKSEVEKAYRYNNRAYTYFVDYRYNGDSSLEPEKIDEYTLSINVMEALLTVRENHRTIAVGSGTRINVWERLGDLCNDLKRVKDPMGKPMYPHNLPKTWKSLKRKCEQYDEARHQSEEEGYRSVIHKSYGNNNASLLKDNSGSEEENLCASLIRQFLSLHMNWNNVQVMKEYNKAAATFGLAEIKSPATIGAYRKKLDTVTKTRRKGSNAWHSELKKQVRRKAPETAFTFLVFDGWDVELLYQKTETTKVRKNGVVRQETKTTYHNRKTLVVVLDACKKYPIGYAIGDGECNALIKEALTNAVKHAKELFGARYMPHQLQCDNYHKSSLFPFYEQMTKHLTPAEVKNAQAKVVEPYFKYLITEYFQYYPSFSGFGITSSKKIQPNTAYLNEHRKFIPNEQRVIEMIEEVMQKERAKKIDDYLNAWECTPEERKIPFGDESYLMLMGQTSGRTNKLEGRGIIMERNGFEYVYDSLDRTMLNHLGESWVVHYDEDDMSRVLICNAGRKGTKDEGKELGTLRYMLEEKEAIPMALVDQTPEHFQKRTAIKQFNEDLKREIIDTAQNDMEVIKNRAYGTGLPGHNILERLLIADSNGQHKDNRNALKGCAKEIECQEMQLIPPLLYSADEDYEFNPLDAAFSR